MEERDYVPVWSDAGDWDDNTHGVIKLIRPDGTNIEYAVLIRSMTLSQPDAALIADHLEEDADD